MSGEVSNVQPSIKTEYKTWTELLPMAEKMPYEQYLEVVKEAQSHYKRRFKQGKVYDAVTSLKTESTTKQRKTLESNRSISKLHKAYLNEGKGLKESLSKKQLAVRPPNMENFSTHHLQNIMDRERMNRARSMANLQMTPAAPASLQMVFLPDLQPTTVNKKSRLQLPSLQNF